ncbi:Tim17-domain-containing protein [Exidia glandulosa HHB12029]|uniref:Tim17-domain-containing protein n=1 Tax=Exidia glandulosa HHB12029 TaxID=1314781 RepID=A0A165KJ18_EXIGL|nr:Tim17-domain-containing protein [Exidia glandulosa HHB12029]
MSSSQPSATDTLRTAQFQTSAPGQPDDQPKSAAELLAGQFDPARLHPLAAIGDKLDYLLLDDDKINEIAGANTALPSRGWSDDLCYGTGSTYLAGLSIGGVWGLREGARRPLAVSNTRLRLNSILNSVTRRGSWMGNSAGILALVYNGVNSSIDAWRGKHDAYGSMAAGAATGALYKSTAGVRPMLVASLLMTGAAGAWSQVKRSVL